MSGKRAFLDLLKQEGVEIMFGNPGTTELPLMDAFATENELRYLLGLQEAALMAMADGYAQASGKLAVLNLHTTPGLGNAMGMLYDAEKAGAPILLTAAKHEQSFTATEPILWADLPVIARPLVKWSFEVHRLADLPRLVHRAAKTALAPPTGPGFLSLPGDILRADADIDLMAPTRIAPRTRGDRPAIAAAADILAGAKGTARDRLKTASDAIAKERDALRTKARALASAVPVQALALLEAIGAMLPKDAVVIEEALSNAPGIRQLINSDDPQSYFGLRGGGIGWGLPATIGAKLALPERPVVGIIGDGSALYTTQALWTAARYNIGATFVILNNTS